MNHGDLTAAWKAGGNVLGNPKPASTLIVGGIADMEWKIEIEGSAVA